MKIVVLQSNYLPWRGYFSLIKEADVFCFYDEVKYTKNDWRNRNKIYLKNGLSWITIPVDKKSVNLKISEVTLDNCNWQNKHYKSISQGYKKSPYYHQLEFLFDYVFLNNNWDTLSELNQSSIEVITNYLEINTSFVNSKNYSLLEGKVPRLIHLLEQLKCEHYISGPAATDYISPYLDDFKKSGIEVNYIEYKDNSYPQLASPFENYVSIIDLIANVEKNEINYFL